MSCVAARLRVSSSTATDANVRAVRRPHTTCCGRRADAAMISADRCRGSTARFSTSLSPQHSRCRVACRRLPWCRAEKESSGSGNGSSSGTKQMSDEVELSSENSNSNNNNGTSAGQPRKESGYARWQKSTSKGLFKLIEQLNPEQSQRAVSVSDHNVLRRKGHLKEQDFFIQFIIDLHEYHDAPEVMAMLEKWIEDYRVEGKRSKLKRLVPSIGKLFTPLPLSKVLNW